MSPSAIQVRAPGAGSARVLRYRRGTRTRVCSVRSRSGRPRRPGARSRPRRRYAGCRARPAHRARVLQPVGAVMKVMPLPSVAGVVLMMIGPHQSIIWRLTSAGQGAAAWRPAQARRSYFARDLGGQLQRRTSMVGTTWVWVTRYARPARGTARRRTSPSPPPCRPAHGSRPPIPAARRDRAGPGSGRRVARPCRGIPCPPDTEPPDRSTSAREAAAAPPWGARSCPTSTAARHPRGCSVRLAPDSVDRCLVGLESVLHAVEHEANGAAGAGSSPAVRPSPRW